MRRALSYSNVMATLALFVALGGSGYAAIKITGKHVRNNSLTSVDVRNNSLTAADVRNGSLRAQDFRADQLPTMWSYRRDSGAFQTNDLPDIPGFGSTTLFCTTPEQEAILVVHNTSDTRFDSFTTITDPTGTRRDRDTLEPQTVSNVALFFPGDSEVVWQFAPQVDSDPGPVVTVYAHISIDQQSCHITAQAVAQDPTNSG